MEQLKIINDVVCEAEGIAKTGFPIEVFPQAMQKIALDWKVADGFLVEFSCMAMMSAISSALGNAIRINVHGNWVSNASMYCIFVGRPGLGKTPPLTAAFKPLYDKDEELYQQFKAEYAQYKAAKGNGEDGARKPVLMRHILNDFTPEALFAAHSDNPRGIVILVDEILGMFKSANRYVQGALVEQLLSAWSGAPIIIARKTDPEPLRIAHPFINIIGTTQTKAFCQLIDKGYADNGLLDRFIFVYPKYGGAVKMSKTPTGTHSPLATRQLSLWTDTINNVLQISDAGTILNFGDDADDLFIEWWNTIADSLNAIKDDADVPTRETKRNCMVARLALLFQVAKWACGEGHIEFVDKKSVEAAIRLSDYLEECYDRIMEGLPAAEGCPRNGKKKMLDAMEDNFTTGKAIEYGKNAGLSESTVKKWLAWLVENKFICREKNGNYSKVNKKVESADRNTLTLSTFSTLPAPVEFGKSVNNTESTKSTTT